MSAVDHLSYMGNTIHGENGNIVVTYSTFDFSVHAEDNFKFTISPGKESTTHPVLWEPTQDRLVNSVTSTKHLLKIKRLSPDSLLPQRATPDSSGYDVVSSQPTNIPAQSTITIPLGFAMQFDPTLKCELRPRSGLSLKGI